MTRTHFQNQCKQLLVISITFLSISLLCQPAWSHNKNNTIKYAPNPSYDNIPITPKTWEEVDLIYYCTISGHRYTNSIELLRPKAWLHKRHMDIMGSKVTLSMPEFGIVNVTATVIGIESTQIDTRGVDWSKQKSAPVIGKFMHYVTDVRTYAFKDSLGHISHINTTPNHPFYVKNKYGFLAIGNVSDKDTLVGVLGSGSNYIDGVVHLVCAEGKHNHCGEASDGDGLLIPVYNFELYKRHVYRVGSSGTLVHNMCPELEREEYAATIIQNSWRDFQEKSPKFKYEPIEMRYISSNDAYSLLTQEGNIIGTNKHGYLFESIVGCFSNGRTTCPLTRESVYAIRSSKGQVTKLSELFPRNSDPDLPFIQTNDGEHIIEHHNFLGMPYFCCAVDGCGYWSYSRQLLLHHVAVEH